MSAGKTNHGTNAIAIGTNAGTLNQSNTSIAIGFNAGNDGQGTNSIAIGTNAGSTNQHANTILINATGGVVNTSTTSAFYVAPIRGVASATPVLVYSTANNEITYNTSSIKYKKNVIDLNKETSKIYNIRAREFDAISDNKHYIGYIAEELQDIDTNFTWKNQDGLPEGIEWFNILIYLIEEVKKLKQKVNELEST